jgi:hypothetical protein
MIVLEPILAGQEKQESNDKQCDRWHNQPSKQIGIGHCFSPFKMILAAKCSARDMKKQTNPTMIGGLIDVWLLKLPTMGANVPTAK